MSSSNERRASVDSKAGTPTTGARPTPSLLPSAFPNEEMLSPYTEGYEGERLHEMFLSAQNLQRHNHDEYKAYEPSTENFRVEQSMTQPDEEANFEPFFTIIEDSATGAQYHPYVHYVFSDDDPDLMTNAIFSALDHINRGAGDSPVESEKTAEKTNSKERCVIIDVDHNGESIVSARSLVPEWQVFGHSITTAPTFGESSSRQDAGLMLRIEGQEGPHTGNEQEWLPPSKETTNEELLESLHRLASQFDGELDALRKLTLSDVDPEIHGHEEQT